MEVPSYKMLAIIVLGGLGNPLGTVVAGLIIGFAEVMLSTYTKLPIPKDAIAFVVLIIVSLDQTPPVSSVSATRFKGGITMSAYYILSAQQPLSLLCLPCL